MELYNQFFEATHILYTRIFQAPFFFFDLWSINHMWSGFIVFLIATALHFNRPLIFALVCLVGYEIFELSLTYFALPVFLPEIIKDQVTDIFIGFVGCCIGLLIVSNYQILMQRYTAFMDKLFMFFASMTVAFLWQVFSMNSLCANGRMAITLNLILFFLWLAQGYLTIYLLLKYGLFKNVKPWLIIIFTLAGCTIVNFIFVSSTNAAMHLDFVTFKSWLLSIWIKGVLTPFLPFLILFAYKIFTKLIGKSAVAFSNYRKQTNPFIGRRELINN